MKTTKVKYKDKDEDEGNFKKGIPAIISVGLAYSL